MSGNMLTFITQLLITLNFLSQLEQSPRGELLSFAEIESCVYTK